MNKLISLGWDSSLLVDEELAEQLLPLLTRALQVKTTGYNPKFAYIDIGARITIENAPTCVYDTADDAMDAVKRLEIEREKAAAAEAEEEDEHEVAA